MNKNPCMQFKESQLEKRTEIGHFSFSITRESFVTSTRLQRIKLSYDIILPRPPDEWRNIIQIKWPNASLFNNVHLRMQSKSTEVQLEIERSVKCNVNQWIYTLFYRVELIKSEQWIAHGCRVLLDWIQADGAPHDGTHKCKRSIHPGCQQATPDKYHANEWGEPKVYWTTEWGVGNVRIKRLWRTSKRLKPPFKNPSI